MSSNSRETRPEPANACRPCTSRNCTQTAAPPVLPTLPKLPIATNYSYLPERVNTAIRSASICYKMTCKIRQGTPHGFLGDLGADCRASWIVQLAPGRISMRDIGDTDFPLHSGNDRVVYPHQTVMDCLAVVRWFSKTVENTIDAIKASGRERLAAKGILD